MSSTTPFFIVSGDGDSKDGPDPDGIAANESVRRTLTRPAKQPFVSEDFKNSRRDARLMQTSAQAIQINLRIPNFLRFFDFFPSNIASFIGRRARHHTGKCGLDALFSLIVKIAATDASDKRFLLFGVCKLQIGCE